jgi:hypothetical protein
VTALALGVDHLNTAVEDVRAVAGVLTDKLGLSVVVPYSEYPSFVTIGLSVGTSTLFIDRSDTVFFLRPTSPARWRALSLRPVTAPQELAGELTRRGLSNDGPQEYRQGADLLWTNVFVTGVLPADEVVFFTQYAPALDEQVRAAHEGFLSGGGGALGVTGLAEVGIGGAGPWNALLDKPVTAADADVYLLADGAEVRLLPDGPAGLRYIALRVADLDAAVMALVDSGLSSSRDGRYVRIDCDQLDGLDLRLCA